MLCLRSDVLAGSGMNHSQSDVILLFMRLRSMQITDMQGNFFS